MFRIAFAAIALCGLAAAQECNLDSIVGTHAITYEGSYGVMLPGSTSPALTPTGFIVGVVSITHSGKVTGAATVYTPDRPAAIYEIVDGKVDLNSDCTGTVLMKMRVRGTEGPILEEVDRIIALPEQKEIIAAIDNLGPGVMPAVVGHWKRMSAVPNRAAW